MYNGDSSLSAIDLLKLKSLFCTNKFIMKCIEHLLRYILIRIEYFQQ